MNTMENKWLTIEKRDQEVVLIKCSQEAEGEIVIPEGVTVIKSWAFAGLSNLKTITIPKGVTKIGDYAFHDCGIENMVIPEGVETIGDTAFGDCNNLLMVSIPNSLKKIGDFAFSLCENLQSILVTESSSNNSENVQNVEVEGGKYGCIFRQSHNLKKITLPNSWSKIGGKLLSTYDSYHDYHFTLELSFFNVPKSVKEIEDQDWKARISILDFNGAIPKTNGTFENCTIETLRVNMTKKNTLIPDDIKNALKKADNPIVIYAAPKLCEKQSQVPGYIKVTLASIVRYDGDLDEQDGNLIDINTKYIVSVEPYKLERYLPLTGSIITCASNGIERSFQTVVYEPCDMVLQKIDDSLQALGQKVGGVAGLLNQLETLCRPIPNCQ